MCLFTIRWVWTGGGKSQGSCWYGYGRYNGKEPRKILESGALRAKGQVWAWLWRQSGSWEGPTAHSQRESRVLRRNAQAPPHPQLVLTSLVLLTHQKQLNLTFKCKCCIQWNPGCEILVGLNLVKEVEFLEVIAYLVRSMEYSNICSKFLVGKAHVCIVPLNLAQCLAPSTW